MRVYVTMVGRSYWATLNSFWAVLKEDLFQPEKVFLIYENGLDERANTLKDDILTLLSSYGMDSSVETVQIERADFKSAGKKVEEIIEDNGETALDITAGRKALVAGSLVTPSVDNLEHVFYLYLDDLKNADRPYPSIESHRMEIKDFRSDFRG